MLHTLRRCWDLMTPHERRRWASSVPLLAAAAALEALNAGAVYLLLRGLGDPSSLASLPLASGRLSGDPRSVLLVGAVAMAAMQAAKALLLVLVLRVTTSVNADSAASLSVRLLRAYLDAPFAFHLQRNSNDLLFTAMRASDVVYRMVVFSAVSILAEVLVVAGLVLVLVGTVPPLSLAALGVTLVLLWLLGRSTRGMFASLGSERQRLEQSAQRTLTQALEGIKEVRLRGREAFVLERFAAERRRAVAAEGRFLALSGTTRLLLEAAFVLGIVAVVLVMASDSADVATLTPVLALYAYAGFRVIPSANRIQMHLANVRFGAPSVEKVHADLAACAPIGRADGAPATTGVAAAPLRFAREVRLEGIRYAYGGGHDEVLRGVDLVLGRGESLGIVGTTGAGKTTLLHILLGLLEPTGGRVTVDGVDVREHLASWQRSIGYVPQFVHLVDDTLARNVAFCTPDEEVDEARVRAALGRAQLGAFVEAQPDGIRVLLGERGVRLSGGERQRVAIARALYDDPEVLVFDEGTSSLDPATEREVTAAVEGLHGEKTMVVVAHRLATVKACDRIVVLERGVVTGSGTYDELLRGHEGFRRLAAMPPGAVGDGRA